MTMLPNHLKTQKSLEGKGTTRLRRSAKLSLRNFPEIPLDESVPVSPFPKEAPPSLLTDEAATAIAQGKLPDLESICRGFYETLLTQKAPFHALPFIGVMKKVTPFDREAVRSMIENPETNHILVSNKLLKVVLIHWKPGKNSSIHGHPKGGCVFKVLHGSLEEKRYSPDESVRLLATSTFQTGGMGYIDDNMAYHAVGNPFDVPAISLHAYTPGK